MIHIYFRFDNPFSEQVKTLYCYDKHISLSYLKYQNLCIQIDKDNTIFCFKFEWTFRQDHAGPWLEFGLFGYNIMINVYDSRHWDYENDKWEEYGNVI